MAMTFGKPGANDQVPTEGASPEQRYEPEVVVDAVHKTLTDRNEFFDRALNQAIARNSELLVRLAR
ncbi:MAG: hypothetical protein ACRD0P_04830 [Stackebrandtia sp.]